MRPSKWFVAVCVITAAALFGGCQPSQTAGAEKQAVMKTQPGSAPAPVKAVQVKKAGSSTTATSKTTAVDAAHAAAPAPVSRAATAREEAIVTTISGCLERDGDMFKMTDTAGENAPKSRTWKSGFIKKGSAAIDIVEGATRLKLAGHIGRRVNITGLLSDREMHAQSVRVISQTCE
jgi:hypothetical protein